MKLAQNVQTGIERGIMLGARASLLAEKHPELKIEPKYGKVRVLVECEDDLQNVLCLGYTWQLENYFSYGAVEDPFLGCDISWKFLREFVANGWEKFILGDRESLCDAV